MLSSFKTSFIFAAVLSVIASSALPVKRIPGIDFNSKMFPIDATKNECNLPGSPQTPVIQLARALGTIDSSERTVGGAAENGWCGPTATISLKNGRSVDVTNVGLCDDCSENDIQANEAVFRALGADPTKPLEGVKFQL